MVDVCELLRHRALLADHQDNIRFMLERYRNGDYSYTPAVRRMTLVAARNAFDAFMTTLAEVEAEVLPKPTAASRLPVTVSPAGAA